MVGSYFNISYDNYWSTSAILSVYCKSSFIATSILYMCQAVRSNKTPLGSRLSEDSKRSNGFYFLQWWAPGRVGMGTSYKSASGPWRIRKLYIWRSEFLGTNRGVKLRRIKYELSSMVANHRHDNKCQKIITERSTKLTFGTK